MIPSDDQIRQLWDKYSLPENKRIHVTHVARVAEYLSACVMSHVSGIRIDIVLLHAAALLHDIDKNVLKREGEQHPDAGVRILKNEGCDELLPLVISHPLHSILDPKISPKTWEEKLLYLSDKMVKYEIITVDKRFDLWRAENLPKEGRIMLEKAYPLVKKLEAEIVGMINVKAWDIAGLVG
ncbi:HDIG domain-containing protein [Candidatus Gottesmanbacteria bacterium]|nr:HDIG domain-containing protein [Candidatus Gottesmanbacteria bacterium]